MPSLQVNAKDDTTQVASASTRSRRSKRDLVKEVNSLDTTTFSQRYIDGHLSKGGYDSNIATAIQHKTTTDIAADQLTECFDLVSLTSQHDYENSSIGWRPVHKRHEMEDKDMHYLLVKPKSADGISSADGSSSIDGFLSFMVTHDSLPAVPVLYVYEIHLKEFLRHTGVGSRLMQVVYDIAVGIGLSKVMLTCFISNQSALHFYQKHGFEKDVCSPQDRKTRSGVVKADYLILSRDVTSG